MDLVGDEIVIRVINGVLAVSRKVESNKIGLKTCEKICRDMNGTFDYKDEDNYFTVRITIPVYERPAAPEAPESPADPAGDEAPFPEE